MFRNISGSVGIAVITAMGAERLQAHRAYLAGHLNAVRPAVPGPAGAAHTDACRRWDTRRSSAHDAAMGLINQTLEQQAAILSYMDLYAYTALAAFCLVPLTLLFRAGVAGRPGGR